MPKYIIVNPIKFEGKGAVVRMPGEEITLDKAEAKALGDNVADPKTYAAMMRTTGGPDAAVLAGQVEALEAENAALRDQVAELEGQVVELAGAADQRKLSV